MSLVFRRCPSLVRRVCGRRCLSVSAVIRTSTPPVPWFVDGDSTPKPFDRRPSPPHLPQKFTQDVRPLPDGAPQILRELHAHLLHSPLLEASTLVVMQPTAPPTGPELPFRLPQGRRRRGGTYAGESDFDMAGGIWNWVVMAQVSSRISIRLVFY